jgi:UDP-N-acetylmuramoyl-L-alanyl-D-glutamate--2,6-diaminopimelate ligase
LENVLTALRTMNLSACNDPFGLGLKTECEKTLANPIRLICLFGCSGDRDRIKRPLMAAVAERLADVVIVTNDNPRTESASAIITEICTGFSPGWKTTGKISVEPDRHAAIKLAINMAQPGDVVLLAGKGHENYQIIGTTKHHFDDVEEAEAALRDIYI